MKKIIYHALIVLTAVSCGSETKEKETKEVKEKDTAVVATNLRDTIVFSIEPVNEKYYCTQTASRGFCPVPGKKMKAEDPEKEEKLIKANKEVVKKNGDGDLVVIAKTGEIVFKSNSDEDSETYIKYNLHEVNGNFVTLMLQYFESFEYMVVNTETGKSFKTWGIPVFNSEKTMAVSGNSDLAAGFTNNGIQLFGMDGAGWNLKMQKILDDWGPENLFWLNDSVILSKKNIPDETDTADGLKTEFVKILLKHEKIN